MAVVGDDCYFYYYSSCAKGSLCMYRHTEEARLSETTCAQWQAGACYRPNCKFRHMDIQVDRNQTPCYWENQPVGCTKPLCVFQHFKPRPFSSDQPQTGTAGNRSPVAPVSPEDGQPMTASASSGHSSPIVQPVIIPMIDSDVESAGTASNVGTPIKSTHRAPSMSPPRSRPSSASQNVAAAVKSLSSSIQARLQRASSPQRSSASPRSEGSPRSGPSFPSNVRSSSPPSRQGSSPTPRHRPASPARMRGEARGSSIRAKSVKQRLGNSNADAASSDASGKRPSVVSLKSKSIKSDKPEVQVMSLEETLRQRALESMMRAREQAAAARPEPEPEPEPETPVEHEEPQVDCRRVVVDSEPEQEEPQPPVQRKKDPARVSVRDRLGARVSPQKAPLKTKKKHPVPLTRHKEVSDEEDSRHSAPIRRRRQPLTASRESDDNSEEETVAAPLGKRKRISDSDDFSCERITSPLILKKRKLTPVASPKETVTVPHKKKKSIPAAYFEDLSDGRVVTTPPRKSPPRKRKLAPIRNADDFSDDQTVAVHMKMKKSSPAAAVDFEDYSDEDEPVRVPVKKRLDLVAPSRAARKKTSAPAADAYHDDFSDEDEPVRVPVKKRLNLVAPSKAARKKMSVPAADAYHDDLSEEDEPVRVAVKKRLNLVASSKAARKKMSVPAADVDHDDFSDEDEPVRIAVKKRLNLVVPSKAARKKMSVPAADVDHDDLSDEDEPVRVAVKKRLNLVAPSKAARQKMSVPAADVDHEDFSDEDEAVRVAVKKRLNLVAPSKAARKKMSVPAADVDHDDFSDEDEPVRAPVKKRLNRVAPSKAARKNMSVPTADAYHEDFSDEDEPVRVAVKKRLNLVAPSKAVKKEAPVTVTFHRETVTATLAQDKPLRKKLADRLGNHAVEQKRLKKRLASDTSEGGLKPIRLKLLKSSEGKDIEPLKKIKIRTAPLKKISSDSSEELEEWEMHAEEVTVAEIKPLKKVVVLDALEERKRMKKLMADHKLKQPTVEKQRRKITLVTDPEEKMDSAKSDIPNSPQVLSLEEIRRRKMLKKQAELPELSPDSEEEKKFAVPKVSLLETKQDKQRKEARPRPVYDISLFTDRGEVEKPRVATEKTHILSLEEIRRQKQLNRQQEQHEDTTTKRVAHVPARRSKAERQIYVPPARKNASVSSMKAANVSPPREPSVRKRLGEPLPLRAQRLGEPLPLMAQRLGEPLPLKAQRLGEPLLLRAQRLGESLPLKAQRLGEPLPLMAQKLGEPAALKAGMQGKSTTERVGARENPESRVWVKTFSEIMAEKRKRRQLERQQQQRPASGQQENSGTGGEANKRAFRLRPVMFGDNEGDSLSNSPKRVGGFGRAAHNVSPTTVSQDTDQSTPAQSGFRFSFSGANQTSATVHSSALHPCLSEVSEASRLVSEPSKLKAPVVNPLRQSSVPCIAPFTQSAVSVPSRSVTASPSVPQLPAPTPKQTSVTSPSSLPQPAHKSVASAAASSSVSPSSIHQQSMPSGKAAATESRRASIHRSTSRLLSETQDDLLLMESDSVTLDDGDQLDDLLMNIDILLE